MNSIKMKSEKLTEKMCQPELVRSDTEWKQNKKTDWVSVTLKKSERVQNSLNEQEDQSQSLNWLTFIVHPDWKRPILSNL